MEIDIKYANTILQSLKYSIQNIRKYHENMQTIDSPVKWDYDYEKHSLAPINEAIEAIYKAKKQEKLQIKKLKQS